MANLNFNLNPYYDDFSEGKNFHRILFKPGYAVQARELTQLQTILQNQIEKFGKHVFKEGSLVLGGAIDIDLNIQFVKIKDNDSANTPIANLNAYVNQTIVGSSSGVKAKVIDVVDGVETSTNTKTLLISYTGSGANGVNTVFSTGETITVANLASPVVISSANSTGSASRFTIDEGTIFFKNHFINFGRKSIVVDAYSNTPSKKVGFDFTESIVTSTQDTSLLDPALGSYNYSAPGADRYQISPNLKVIGINDVADETFSELLSINAGVIQGIRENSQYSVLAEELARRTYDESGDYYVQGMNISIREHLNNNTNLGYFTTGEGGNNQLLMIGVEPGKAYVQGYEVSNTVTRYVPVEKGITYQNFDNQVISARFGNYITVKELVGTWDLDSPINIELYDTAQRRISNDRFALAAQTGNKIGTAKVKGIEYASGISGSANSEYYLYLFDINMTSNTFSNVRSIYSNTTVSSGLTTPVGADIVLDPETNSTILEDQEQGVLLYYVGSDAVRKIKDTTDTSDTRFTFRKSYPVTIATDGSFTLTSAVAGEEFPYSTGALSDAEKRQFVIAVTDNVSINLTGTARTFTTNTRIIGSGTSFTNFNLGDKVEVNGVANTYIITQITSDTDMNVDSNSATAVSGAVISKVYKKGDILDFTADGIDAGVERTITSSSATSLSFDTQETYSATVAAVVTASLTKTGVNQISKVLKPSRYVKINTATNVNGTAGPFDLGFSDVIKIKSIRTSLTDFTANTDGTNDLSSFIFDDGQREEYYEHATLTPAVTLASNTKILVELDYYEPDFSQGIGYYSVESYPVNDTNPSSSQITTAEIPFFVSPTTGASYDLRNYLDFRPQKVATATDATTVAAANTNPAATGSYNVPAGGLKILTPGTQIQFDYSSYLGRKDVVVVDKTGGFSVIKGTPAVNPITPATPDKLMALATTYIPPYPSLSPAYGAILGRPDLVCASKKVANIRHTMRDIGILKQRIENLEYYTSLSILEKNAADMLVLDAAGNDRFKNGIFTDTFADHSLGATYNPDYNIVVDTNEKSIRPKIDYKSVSFQYVSGSNVQKSNNVVTLPYTETTLLEQPYATTFRNVESSIFRFIGNLDLNPETDIWYETQYTEKVYTNTVGNTALLGTSTTTWNDWSTPTSGTNVPLYRLYNDETNEAIAESTDLEFLKKEAQTLSRNVLFAQNNLGLTLSNPSLGWQGTGKLSPKAVILAKTKTFSSKFATRIEVVSAGSSSSRTGTTVFYELSKSTSETSSTSTYTTIPYIRPQVIKLTGKGLKANTKFFVFFDGEKMSDYASPTTSSFPTADLKKEGQPIISDANGYVYCLLRLPTSGKKFRFGSRSVKLTDSPTNDEEATSRAENFFVAQGTLVSTTRNITSTYTVTPVTKSVTETTGTGTGQPGQTVWKQSQGASCMAYSFFVNVPSTQEGIFLTSVDVFMARKSSEYGVWFEIKETDSDGGITRNVVPYSEVWFTPDQLVTSDNASVPLNVKFKVPIFLQNNTQYAFVIHTVAINPDSYFWVSKIGETDVITNQQVTGRQLTGTLYTTNNNLNWDIVPNTDLKVKFYRAAFDTNVTGVATLGNQPIEILEMSSVKDGFRLIGETVESGDRLTLTNISGTIDAANNIIRSNTSNIPGSIIQVSGSTYYTSNVGYLVNEGVTIRYKSNNDSTGVTANISSITNANGTLNMYRSGYKGNTINAFVDLTDSTGGFIANDWIYGVTSNNYGVVKSVDPLIYSVVDYQLSYLKIKNTDISFAAKGTVNATSTLDSSFSFVTPLTNNYLTQEKAVLSRSKEISLLSSANSSQFQVTMTSSSEYVSPVLDLNRTHAVYVRNIINANTVGEANVSYGGGALNKYISRIVTLADGQDAEDLMVTLTAYKPSTSDVLVYYKIKHAEDYDTFDNKKWTQMSLQGDANYSSVANQNDFIELKYQIPTANMNGVGNVASYTSDGIQYSGFKQFQVKIVLTGTNSALVPKVADLRVIALQL